MVQHFSAGNGSEAQNFEGSRIGRKADYEGARDWKGFVVTV